MHVKADGGQLALASPWLPQRDEHGRPLAILAPRLFEAFYTTKPGGLGMGLSISRSIIDSHRGRLWATSNSDHGATFHLALPGMR